VVNLKQKKTAVNLTNGNPCGMTEGNPLGRLIGGSSVQETERSPEKAIFANI
jgi:hypothetical protein